MEKYVDLTPIANSFLYGSVYKFWLRQLVTVFAPFALLTIINLKTILQLKKHLTPKASLRTDNDYRARRSLGKVSKFIRDDKSRIFNIQIYILFMCGELKFDLGLLQQRCNDVLNHLCS